MKPHSNIPVLVAFCFATLVIVVSIASARQTDAAEAQMKITLIATSLGGLIALLSAVLLLLRATSGFGFRELLPFTLPLLAGALITSFHWAVAVVFGVLGVAFFIREMVGIPPRL